MVFVTQNALKTVLRFKLVLIEPGVGVRLQHLPDLLQPYFTFDTNIIHISIISTSGRCCSWSPFRQLTGNNISGHYLCHYFLFPITWGQTPFQTQLGILVSPGGHFGVLGAHRRNYQIKKLIQQKFIRGSGPISRPDQPFWCPLVAIFLFCRRQGISGIAGSE